MEVKIGITQVARELVLESAQTPAEIEAAVTEALADPEGTLSLADEKGRKILVPSAKVAYVEIAETETRRVGFGAL